MGGNLRKTDASRPALRLLSARERALARRVQLTYEPYWQGEFRASDALAQMLFDPIAADVFWHLFSGGRGGRRPPETPLDRLIAKLLAAVDEALATAYDICGGRLHLSELTAGLIMSELLASPIIQEQMHQIASAMQGEGGGDGDHEGAPASGGASASGGDDDAQADAAINADVHNAARNALGIASLIASMQGEGGAEGFSQGGKPSPLKDVGVIVQRRQDWQKMIEFFGRVQSALSSLPHSREVAVADAALTRDIVRVFPTEQTAFLNGNHPMHDVAVARYASRGLLGLVERREVEAGSGPLVVLLDTSGSMAGSRVALGRAVMLSLYKDAQRRGREFWAGLFSDKEDFEWATLPEGLMKAFEGGTDFARPLYEALERYRREYPRGRLDVVIITDGECNSLPGRLVEQYNEAGARVVAMLVCEGSAAALNGIERLYELRVDLSPSALQAGVHKLIAWLRKTETDE